MTIPVAWSLQVALRTHLSAQERIESLIGNPARIFDSVPYNAIFPLLTIGQSRIRAVDCAPGSFEHDLRLNAYSKWGGRREVRLLTEAVYDALQDATFTLEGGKVIASRFIFADMLRPPRDDVFSGVMRFRLITETIQSPAEEA